VDPRVVSVGLKRRFLFHKLDSRPGPWCSVRGVASNRAAPRQASRRHHASSRCQSIESFAITAIFGSQNQTLRHYQRLSPRMKPFESRTLRHGGSRLVAKGGCRSLLQLIIRVGWGDFIRITLLIERSIETDGDDLDRLRIVGGSVGVAGWPRRRPVRTASPWGRVH